MAHNNFNPPALTTHSQKRAAARDMLDLPAKAENDDEPAGFESMHISAAANGISIEHTPKSKPKKGGSGSGSGSGGPSDYTPGKKHVFGSDHAIMRHVNAIFKHCSDCED